MVDNEYLASLQILIAKIDTQTELLMAINGYVREHGEQLAANKQWIWGHKETHEKIDKDMHTLSSWLWKLSGGTGLFAILATVFQFMKL